MLLRAIEETRARVGNEVDALSYKTDVPARVGDFVDEKKQAVKDKVTGVKDAITRTSSDAVPSGEQIGRLKDTAERNPLGLAIGGAAVGFVAGLLLPSTRVEDQEMGEMSDRMIDAAKETASDALESGKKVAQMPPIVQPSRGRISRRVFRNAPRTRSVGRVTGDSRTMESRLGRPRALAALQPPERCNPASGTLQRFIERQDREGLVSRVRRA